MYVNSSIREQMIFYDHSLFFLLIFIIVLMRYIIINILTN